MTNRRKRAYEIIIISLMAILMTLCAYLGITAIQKSMTLNLGFQSSPKVLCELQVDGVPIFDNTTNKVAEYVELSGNTLMFDKDRHTSVFGAETFQLTLKNYAQTESQLLVNFENATVNGGNEVFILDNLAHTFTVTPTENLVSLSMTRVLKVDIEKTGVVLSNSNLTNISDDSYYLNLDEENSLSAIFNLASGYKEPFSISATTSKDTYTSSTGSITIPSENLGKGNIKITASAVPNIASISYGTMTNCSSSVNTPTIQIGEPYETTITADTNNGYILDSVTVDGLDSSEYTITKTTSQEWTLSIPSVSKGFSISANARYPVLTINYGIFEGDGFAAADLTPYTHTKLAYGKTLAKTDLEGVIHSAWGVNPGWWTDITSSAKENCTIVDPNSLAFTISLPYNMPAIFYIFENGPGVYSGLGGSAGNMTHQNIPTFEKIKLQYTNMAFGLSGSSIVTGVFGVYFKMPASDANLTMPSSCWSGRSCFPAGTQVYTESGYKNIEDIQNGDMVWSYNETTQEFELKEVYNTYVRYSYTEIITIGIGETEITATYNHKFLTQNRGYVPIKELTTEDLLIANGQVYQISSYKSEMTTDYFYNFDVQDNHNYLVSDKQIVVHNPY